MKSDFPAIRSTFRTRMSLCWLIAVLFWGGAANLHAQVRDIDTAAPVIELDELKESVADVSQVFTAQVADNEELKDVALYHRREGQSAYQRTLMNPLGFTGIFSASIATDPTDLRAIEYYIQARDETGNRTVSAFAFDPYSRSLQAPPAALPLEEPTPSAETEALSAASEPFYKKRWVQIGLGVVAVGVLASQLGGEDGEDRNIVPVTINLQ